VEAQEAFFFVELDFNQAQQLLVTRLAVERVEQPVEAADLGVAGFVSSCWM
jgi:hypothetical protein